MTPANKKPWGYEYLLYSNQDVAIWHLVLDGGQETSLHSHPNKKTGLVVLDGAAKISFLSDSQKLFAGEKTMIRHGVFHKSKNMTRGSLSLLEIETPVNKADIVRLKDAYGRAGQPYNDDEWLDVDNIEITGTFGSCNLKYGTTDDTSIHDYELIMITVGKIKFEGYDVCGPGDILSIENLNKLIDNFGPAELEGIFIRSCI
jgi:mannose-6-phosphate isomerase-like protein (cupin superfamily)